jgi:lipoprotein-anchoring transpeptidase ErfK/SrfK
MMQVYTNGQLVQTIPVSLGKAGFPTLSGTLVVWYKSQKVMMDSCASGIDCTPGTPNYYKEDVYWDTAISTDGFFIHDAYWDIFAQGHYDYSHGCVNIAPNNAIWFFGYSQVGDVVQISNTARQADAGDGEEDWQIPFDQYPNSGGAAPDTPRQNSSGGV